MKSLAQNPLQSSPLRSQTSEVTEASSLTKTSSSLNSHPSDDTNNKGNRRLPVLSNPRLSLVIGIQFLVVSSMYRLSSAFSTSGQIKFSAATRTKSALSLVKHHRASISSAYSPFSQAWHDSQNICKQKPFSQNFSGRGATVRLFSTAQEEPITISSSHKNIDSEIRSKPKPGGTWNQSDPVGWAKHFGGRDPALESALLAKAQLRLGDEGYFDVSTVRVPGVTIVRTKEEARIVMERLMSPESEKLFHSCDTEVMEIALKEVGPVGNGYVTCASVYSGPDFDYGLGDGPGTALWIDNLDDSFGVLQEFKEFFEDERFRTVWHNYGFDRHVMWNEGIDVKGFGGDTMHMARLQDTSRAKYGVGTGYGLEALTADILGRRKKPMKEIFGVARLRKDGSAGSLVDVPPVEVLQRDPKFRKQWIVYSAFDAEGTWMLREELEAMLEEMPWVSL